MKKILFLFLLTSLANDLLAQYVYTIKADSVKITNCDSAELILENHTQNIPGFLFNTGNGRTIFKRALQKINDSVYLIGADTLKIQGNTLASNGVSYSGDTIQWGGSITNDTKVTVNNNRVWFKTPFNASEGFTKTGQVFIGDSNYIQRWKSSTTGEYQQNSNLVVSKTRENNNENVELVTLTTADAPGKNGWYLMDYTNSSGLVQPRMETYSNAGPTAFSGFEHDVYAKSQGNAGYLLNLWDYDSLDLKAKYSPFIGNLFVISNNYVPGFYIDNNFDVGIGKSPASGMRLDVAGKASFTDTLALGSRASYTSNIHASLTPYSLIDKMYSDSAGTTVHYSHTIFSPSSASVITLIDNQYNIVNPSAALSALTIALPSSPANNDVVIIKFTRAITTISYSGGTIAGGGLTSVSAPVEEILTYDSATATWY